MVITISNLTNYNKINFILLHKRNLLEGGYYLLFLIFIISSVSDLNNSAQIDLRNRIVGSRLMIEKNVNPYAKISMSDGRYIDFHTLNFPYKYTATTVTPFFLFFFYPIFALDQNIAELIWTLAGIVLIGYFFIRNNKEVYGISYCILIQILFLLPPVRLCIERGQYHLIFVGLCCLFIEYLLKNKLEKAFLLFLILSMIRPSFLLFSPILIKDVILKWSKKNLVIISSLCFLVFLFIVNYWDYYTQYFEVVNFYSSESFFKTAFSSFSNLVVQVDFEGQSFGANSYIEIQNTIGYNFLNFGGNMLSKISHFNITNAKLYTSIFVVLFCLSSIFIIFIKEKKAQIFILCSAYIFLELVNPSLRHSYNFCLYLFPLYLINKLQLKQPITIFFYTVLFLIFFSSKTIVSGISEIILVCTLAILSYLGAKKYIFYL